MRKTIYILLTFVLLSSTLLAANDQQKQRPQIWDFGAVSFDRTKYENMLTTGEINGWMPAAIPGSANAYISDFLGSKSVNLSFNGHGGKTHRLRTTNTKLTRFDESTLYDKEHDATFTGFLVSNMQADEDVYIEQQFFEGDIIEYAVGSSGVPATYQLSSDDGQFKQTRSVSGQGAEVIWFSIPRRGYYRLACIDDKLTLARIIRYPAEWGDLYFTGNLPKQCSLAITNRENNAFHKLDYGQSHISLPLGYTYDIALLGDPTKMLVTADSVSFQYDGQSIPVKTRDIELNEFRGKVIGLPESELGKLSLTLTAKYPTTFHAFYVLKGNRYTIYTEPNNQYKVRPVGVNDYVMDTIAAITDLSQLVFTKRPTYPIQIQSQVDLSSATLQFTNTKEPGYVYTFTGTEGIELRSGTYSIAVLGLDSFKLQRTSLLNVRREAVKKRLDFRRQLTASDSLQYTDTLYVGAKRAYTTIRQALHAIDRMHRTVDQHVTIAIDPGQYDEMLRITEPNISLINNTPIPSTTISNGGLDIDPKAVRITGYYGGEYNYFSMTEQYTQSARALRVNMENKELAVKNTGGREVYYNATVVIAAEDVTLENLIIENSFNRYVTRLEAHDRIVPQYDATPRRPTQHQSMEVQNPKYHRPAAALAIAGMGDRVQLKSCRLIGVQNTLYGDAGCRLFMQNCHIMGSEEIISGGLTLVCYRSSIEVFPNKWSSYLLAARTQVGLRGFLFYQCFIRSAEPVQEMIDEQYTEGCNLVKPKDHYGEIELGDPQFDLALESMAYDKAISFMPDDPEFSDGIITPYMYTRGTDGWNPTNDPEGDYDVSIVDLKLGIHIAPHELVIHHIAQPTTMRVITSDGSSFIDQLLTGTQSFQMPKGVYWVIFENNKGRQSKKIEIPE